MDHSLDRRLPGISRRPHISAIPRRIERREGDRRGRSTHASRRLSAGHLTSDLPGDGFRHTDEQVDSVRVAAIHRLSDHGGDDEVRSS
jgi:hypothetical protein